MVRDLGLALSGGGSRAAAFHCGTLLALLNLELLGKVDVVSTVSGGSLFGAAWMAARTRGEADGSFVEDMQEQLSHGFIARSIGRRTLLALTPGVPYSRTHLVADTFDRAFFHGLTLRALPERPVLCMNATILNNGQVAKFTRDGFSAWGMSVPGSAPEHVVPWGDFPIADAVAASAAFPIGLPPFALPLSAFPPGTRFEGSLSGLRALHLTDGGVLENLGIQTLLKSRRYACWNLVVSDAGTHDRPWRGGGLLGSVRGFGVWLLSGRVLDRLMLVMNDKQNRWARQEIYDQLTRSWLVQEVRNPSVERGVGLASYLAPEPHRPRRMLLFVRVAQDWDSFIRSIPKWRLVELAERVGQRGDDLLASDDSARLTAYLEGAGCDLSLAKEHYAQLGGDEAARALNRVRTGFAALAPQTIKSLAEHAAWQVHAAHAIYAEKIGTDEALEPRLEGPR
ncbi:MAG: patatin-like phospholipase family protein [Myxococcota bacterium]